MEAGPSASAKATADKSVPRLRLMQVEILPIHMVTLIFL